MKNNWLIIFASALVIGAAYLLGNVYQNPNMDSITVSAQGTNVTTPDTFVINVSASELAPTTKEVKDLINAKVAKVQEVLTANEIDSKNVQTTNFNVYQEYDWKEGERIERWFRARQSVNVKVKWENFTAKGSKILDEISAIGGIEINDTQFVIDNTDDPMSVAREDAIKKAKEKAENLATLAGAKLGKVKNIIDNSQHYEPYPPMYYAKWMGAGGWALESNLNPGEMDVNVQVTVTYELK